MQNAKNYLNFILGLAILFVLSAPQGIMASQSAITNDLKQTINQVIEILQDEKLKADPTARRAILRKTIDKRFNYKQMAVRALAKNWGPRSSEERTEFINLFRELLERSYANKIENFGDGEIRYVDEIIKGKFAMVKTEVQQHGKFVSLDYKLIKENGNWKVYDFIISGVSMIRNYRSQFSKTLKDKSFKELMESLERSVETKA
jgi:phospholipid transport system substrate-binding protein